jgi:signal transduction histidine kinase
LINNVLDLLTSSAGEKKYEMRKLDFVALTRDTAETYRPQLEKGGFTFQCEFPEQAVEVYADRDALAQVIVNLLSNAEKVFRLATRNNPPD